MSEPVTGAGKTAGRERTRAPLSVGGVDIQHADEQLSDVERRQRACTELLRQAAQRAGLLAADDPPLAAGAISEAATAAIEAYLAREIRVPEPSEEDCRRYFAAHTQRFARGERVRLRHVLFAVTAGVEVDALRKRAEACLIDLRCEVPGADDRFGEVARVTSNCPSGAEGGALGWITREECVPEFASEVFAQREIGVLPRLVRTRFGFHVVEVLAREPGRIPDFDSIRTAVAGTLRQQAFATALGQLLQLLAGEIPVAGVDLDAASSPLVQ